MASSSSAPYQREATNWQLGYAYEGEGHSLLDMLWNLLNAWKSDYSSYGLDMQQKYLDQLLSLRQRDEDRAYNEQWRDNEREYNSASQQLLRLMRTGMSRDAALKLLGTAGAGGSGGSAVPVNGSLPFDNNPSAMQQEQLGIENRNSWANIVLGSLNTATNIASLGFSGANILKQMSYTATQDKVLQQSSQAVGLSSDVIGAVNNAISLGAQFTDDDTKTPQAFTNWINSNADKYPSLQQASQIISSNGNGNPFFQKEFSSAFKDWHEQRNKPRMLDATYDALLANNLLTNVNIDLVRSQAIEAQSNASLLLQKFENAKVEYLNLLSTGEKIDAERNLIESQIELVDSQTESQGLQNNIIRPQAIAHQLQADNLSARYQTEIMLDVMKWSRMGKDDIKESILQKIQSDYQYAAALATFNACTQTDLNEWANNNSQMFTAANAFNYMHFGDILRSVAETLPKPSSDPFGYMFRTGESTRTNLDLRTLILTSFLNGSSVEIPHRDKFSQSAQ